MCEKWLSKDITCAITALTGLATFNVGEVTIHRLFQLPVEHDSKTAGYWSLPKSSQKVMSSTLRSVKLFVIDEVSMVSSLNLAYINLRLEELFCGSEWFGSKNMLFIGDILQLQPVNGNPVFHNISQTSLVYKLGCVASVNIWSDCVLYNKLTISARQKGDKEYSSMLDNVRRGCPTEECLKTLKQRVIQIPVSERFHKLQQFGQSPVCLFPNRIVRDELNAHLARYHCA